MSAEPRKGGPMMKPCPGSGAVYLRLLEPLSIVCRHCMTRLVPTGRRIEWTLPDHTREGALIGAAKEDQP